MARRNPYSTGYVAAKIRAHTARKNSQVALALPSLLGKYKELAQLYQHGDIDEEEYLRLRGSLVRKSKKEGVGHTLARLERDAPARSAARVRHRREDRQALGSFSKGWEAY